MEQQDTLNRIEKQIKKRFPIGAQISEQTIINEFAKQVCDMLSLIFEALYYTEKWSRRQIFNLVWKFLSAGSWGSLQFQQPLLQLTFFYLVDLL